jgi:transposase
MFIRKNRRKKKSGKAHIYWTLVETIRTPKGPRQRIVGYLGDLSDSEQASYDQTRKVLNGEDPCMQGDLFFPVVQESAVPIFPDRVHIERVRDFGNAFVGMGLWRALKLDEFFKERLPRGQEEIPWDMMIAYLAIARFCEASSKLKIAESFTDRSALADIFGIDPIKINKDRLYRAMDELFPQRRALGSHLKVRYGELFGLNYELLLYDMTSTYFEGQCPVNPQAKRGYSRDQRFDCKQVTIALVVTKEGMPLYHEVFDGNRRDVTTVEEIVESVEALFGRAKRIWVMDRGMVSEANLEWLRKRGTYYIVGTPKSWLKRFEQEIIKHDWCMVEPDVEVKIVTTDEHQQELFVLCRSQARREKEHAMIRLFSERIEKGLQKLHQAISRPKRALRDCDKIQRKIGALLKVNSRAARLFDVKLEDVDGKLNLLWKKKENLTDWQDLSDGCYLLRSNLEKSLSPQEIWKAYINLTEVEEAFRINKQDLGLRPIWHHEQDRVQAHIFVCFLALCLQKTFEQMLSQIGLGSSSRKVLDEFQTIKSMDVVMPTAQGDQLKLRVVSEPEPALKILLQRMGMRLPKRLSPNRNVVETLTIPPKQNQTLKPLLIP